MTTGGTLWIQERDTQKTIQTTTPQPHNTAPTAKQHRDSQQPTYSKKWTCALAKRPWILSDLYLSHPECPFLKMKYVSPSCLFMPMIEGRIVTGIKDPCGYFHLKHFSAVSLNNRPKILISLALDSVSTSLLVWGRGGSF